MKIENDLISILSTIQENEAYILNIEGEQNEINLGVEGWRKLNLEKTIFKDDIKIYMKDDLIFVIDDQKKQAYVLRDNKQRVIEFIEDVEKSINDTRKMFPYSPFRHEVGIDVWDYEVRFFIQGDTVEVPVKIIIELIREFINDNYKIGNKRKKNGITDERNKLLEDEIKKIGKIYEINIVIERDLNTEKVKVKINGKTFNIKEILKQLNYNWEPISKVWWKLGDNEYELLEEIIITLHSKGFNF